MKWTKKTYAEELKKGYWDLEPHFHYYCMMKLFKLFRTFHKNKMNINDVNSSMYGEFVIEGKPIKKGFYEHMNLTNHILNEIIKKVKK